MDDAALAVFMSAADDLAETQQLAAASEKPLRPGILELLKSASDRISGCLKGLSHPLRAVHYRGALFVVIPKGDDFTLAVVPDQGVLRIEEKG